MISNVLLYFLAGFSCRILTLVTPETSAKLLEAERSPNSPKNTRDQQPSAETLAMGKIWSSGPTGATDPRRSMFAVGMPVL